MLKLYNPTSQQLENCEFDSGPDVKIYTCGPTVYDYPHIGNWYTFIRYDLLVRFLRTSGYKVNWVMNITDVGHLVSDSDTGEDKMQKGAIREGKSAWDIAEFYADYFKKYLLELNFEEINKLPRATDYINEQVQLVQTLEDKGFTYKIDDGIYFDTSKFSKYSEFAKLNIEGQVDGARVEINSDKRNPSDFALWKFSPKNEKRDMEWDSPWGVGFPGWHLECSAMIHALLKETIDIHGGGIDHIPIHHTNEIAQSEAAYDQPLSRYWLHCNHILVDGKKMSKSLGNFIKLDDIVNKDIPLTIFRAHVLSGHYRSQSEFSWEGLQATRTRIQNWIDKLSESSQTTTNNNVVNIDDCKKELLDALSNDINTPLLLSTIDRQIDTIHQGNINEYLGIVESLTGLQIKSYLKELDENEQLLVAERYSAKKSQNWAKSDELRNKLLEIRIKVKDTKDGQVWSRVI